MAAKRRAEDIQRLLTGYRQSGMKRAEYCHSLGIPITTLDYYLQRESLQARAARPRLAELTVVPEDPSAAAGNFAVVLPNGRRIESSWNFQEADLARLIRVVEAP